MSKRISKYLIAKTLGPFCSPVDEEFKRLMQVNINDDIELQNLLQKYIVPYVNGYDEGSKEIIKDTLTYFIKSNSLDLEHIFDAFQMPFEAPIDGLMFLKKLWFVLYGDTLIEDVSLSDYILDDSEDVVNSLYRKGYR